MEQKGKVFLADSTLPICECGKDVEMNRYENDKKNTTIGFCDCGNVFIGWKPVLNDKVKN